MGGRGSGWRFPALRVHGAALLALGLATRAAAAPIGAPPRATTARAGTTTPASTAQNRTGGKPSGEQGQDPRTEAEWLSVQNAALRARLQLAEQEDFFLVLDPASSSLKLMLKGAVLQSFALQSVEVGAARVAFARQTHPRDWVGRIWTGGQLDPARAHERLEIIAPPVTAATTDSSAAPEVPIPPTPEEAYPVPPLYHVRFADGLALEIRHRAAAGDTAPPTAASAAQPDPLAPGNVPAGGAEAKPDPKAAQGEPNALSTWWHDARSALRQSARDRIRLRLVLSPADAASLYRSLPPAVKLLVLPPP